MSSILKGSALRQLGVGSKVDRAAATIPQTAAQTLFTVAGGRVLVTGLVGEVTTVIGGTATTVSIGTVPTTGTASAVGLGSATAITSKEVGTLISLNATAGGAVVVGADAGRAAQLVPHTPYVVPVGAINYTTSASTTGAIKWTITYIPLDDGATVS